MFKRKPKTYTAMYKEVLYILQGMKDGISIRRKKDSDSLLMGGYEVRINENQFEFYRDRKRFLKFWFSNSFLDIRICTDSYYLIIDSDKILDFELPINKDMYFNLSMVKSEIPEYEDMEYINLIHKISQELGIGYLTFESKNFYS